MSDPSVSSTAGLGRILAAIAYDLILLAAILFLATALWMIAFGSGGANGPLFRLWLYGTCFLYFGWFWTHGGQTLGMKTWKIRLIREDGSPPGWRDALFRFVGAQISWTLLGMGYFLKLWRNDGRMLHDLLSNTRLVRTDR